MEKSYTRKRSAVNLCLNNLVKSLKCDHPCSEGYEVGNLISNNFAERNQGFLVERFIKPPVTLTFEFACKIDLKYIIVQCSVGAQKSSGVELSIQPHSSENQYEFVCSRVLKENEKGFVFHRYSENVKAKFGEEFCYCTFKSARNLSDVKSARIKIFRTQGASVPALGKVDIWGVPQSKVLPVPQIANSVPSQNLTHTTGKDKEIKPSWPSLNLSGERKSLSLQCGWSKHLKVPDDFIDPITCDLMCQPLTLPSGKVIDLSTLELYEKAESQWGRSPSDPFTGIPFTSSSKPVAASDLKARIDKFLCDNSKHPEVQKIPRTVGRSLAPSQNLAIKPSVSKLITDKEQISSYILTNNSLCTRSYGEIPVKRRKVKENGNHDSHIQSDPSKRETLAHTYSGKISPVVPAKKSTAISFQERMEKSLELSLKSTLSSLPSFTADDKESDDKPLVECNVCKLCDNLFSLPCSHFICRNCLISLKTKELLCCSLCKSSFKSHDVQKVHFSK